VSKEVGEEERGTVPVSKEVGEEERGTVTGGFDLWHHCSITGPQAIIKA